MIYGKSLILDINLQDNENIHIYPQQLGTDAIIGNWIQKEREKYTKDKYIEFVGEYKLKEAVMTAWKIIQPDLENLAFVRT